MATLPSLTETINDEFVETWYEIRPDAVDNILDATVVWAALRELGAIKDQVGGRLIERTLRYGEETAEAVDENSLLPMGVPETETAALWTWRYIAAKVQYDLFEVQRNSGPHQITDLVNKRLTQSKESLEQKFEDDLFRTAVSAETGKEIQGLKDLLPTNAAKNTGTYGKVSRAAANDWWIANYQQWDTPREVKLLENMRTAYNTATNNQESPNLLVTDQTTFELYEDFAESKVQVIKDEGTRVADLGFEVLRFKGKMLIYTNNSNFTAGDMFMLNTRYVEIVRDPRFWFEMTDFKDVPRQPAKLAHIFCALNIVGTQPRRHTLCYT